MEAGEPGGERSQNGQVIGYGDLDEDGGSGEGAGADRRDVRDGELGNKSDTEDKIEEGVSHGYDRVNGMPLRGKTTYGKKF